MELKDISGKNVEEQLATLNTFEQNNAGTRTFSVSQSERKSVWSQLFGLVRDAGTDDGNARADLQHGALCACRILSRDRRDLNESVENEHVDLLIHVLSSDDQRWQSKVKFEAKKVLSNLIQQSETVVAHCAKSNILPTLLSLVKAHQLYDESERFDLRLIFLLTAKCPELRTVAKSNLGAVEQLTAGLESMTPKDDSQQAKTSLDVALYMGELIKLLFNLTLEVTVEDTEELTRLCNCLSHVLNMQFEGPEANQVVTSNIVDLLTNFHDLKEATASLFPQHNTDNIDKLLNFLIQKLISKRDENSVVLKEDISPALMILWGFSKIHPHVRKHLKKVILPPLTAKDLKLKPEEGTSARGLLVSLFTSSDSDISTMAAEFLFVLCKHNVGKLVKQTGYGNAAGLLARRGLMLGGRGEAVFSSDSEGDEEEEYASEAHNVNPITRRVEEKRPSPFEGMSEEQKEYEAVKMVNMMNDLMRTGLIRPGTIGEDGKPVELEHVLQLQEGLNIPTDPGQRNDSDSD